MTAEEIGKKAEKALRERLAGNLLRVRERMASAAAQAGRKTQDIRLVAVTKKVPLHVVLILAELGVEDFGENRPEQAPPRVQDLNSAGFACRWHMIGHYQRRKVEQTIAAFQMIHSVHSKRLLETLARAQGGLTAFLEEGRALPILLQVNVSGEVSKQGLSEAGLEALLSDIGGELPEVEIAGLMTMAPVGCPTDRLRTIFSGLRQLRDRLASPIRPLPHLSMGMTQDFEEAILEGATLIRVGRALYEGC